MTNQSSTSEHDPETLGAVTPNVPSGSAEGGSERMHTAREQGSSVPGAIFNFTNSIIGAGAIGLGGAMALSGGAVSVVLILIFGYLTKLSLDMVIRLSVETEGAHGSYEALAQVGLGKPGRTLVLVCKLLYAFGCLVAYIVVIKDNLADALRNLIYGQHDHHRSDDVFYGLLIENAWFTWLVSLLFILPLCLLRDMTPLASFSVVSVASMISIVAIVVYMYFFCPMIGVDGGSLYVKWLEIRPGVLESLGTFVFTFVSQHTVHLVFDSLKPSLRTVKHWKRVSSVSLLSATCVSLSVGVFVYMTFWEETKSDIFQIYPQGWMIDLAKLLLCITMVLTFPLPFFTCRELLIITFVHPLCEVNTAEDSSTSESGDLREPLLDTTQDEETLSRDLDNVSVVTEISRRLVEAAAPRDWLLPNDNRQLKYFGHVTFTVKMWIVTTALAIAAPSLGDVLDLVGCATGTIIAFLLPAILSIKIDGYSHLAMVLLLVGGLVGTVGTFFSLRKIFSDLKLD